VYAVYGTAAKLQQALWQRALAVSALRGHSQNQETGPWAIAISEKRGTAATAQTPAAHGRGLANVVSAIWHRLCSLPCGKTVDIILRATTTIPGPRP